MTTLPGAVETAHRILTWATHRPKTTGFVLGLLYGLFVMLPFAAVEGWWWASGSLLDTLRPLIIYGVIASIVVIGFAVPGAILGAVLVRSAQHSILIRTLLGASLLVGLEYLRELLFFGFTWGHLGYLLAWDLLVIQGAAFGSVYIVSFALSAGVLGITLSLFDPWREGEQPKQRVLYAFLCMAPLLLLHIWGAYVLWSGPRSMHSGEMYTIAVAHSTQTSAQSATTQGFTAHETQIADALAHTPDLLLLPENVFPFLTLDLTTGLPDVTHSAGVHTLYARIRALSQSHPDTYLVFGVDAHEDGTLYNTLVALKNGELAHVFKKRVLMPIGESVPSFMRTGHVKYVHPGPRSASWDLPHIGTTAVLICSEAAYPRLAQKTSSGRTPSLILIPSNDSVFRNPLMGLRHHTLARFRAIETRSYVARSVKGGVSSIIDPYGRVLSHSDHLSGSGTLTTGIPVRTKQ